MKEIFHFTHASKRVFCSCYNSCCFLAMNKEKLLYCARSLFYAIMLGPEVQYTHFGVKKFFFFSFSEVEIEILKDL